MSYRPEDTSLLIIVALCHYYERRRWRRRGWTAGGGGGGGAAVVVVLISVLEKCSIGSKVFMYFKVNKLFSEPVKKCYFLHLFYCKNNIFKIYFLY